MTKADIQFIRSLADKRVRDEEQLFIAEGGKLVEEIRDSKFRIRGKGVKGANSYGKGDQYVIIKVVTPKSLTAEQKDLFEKLAQSFSAMEPDAKTADKRDVKSEENSIENNN